MFLRWRPGVVEGFHAIGMAAEAQRQKAAYHLGEDAPTGAHPQAFAQLLEGLR